MKANQSAATRAEAATNAVRNAFAAAMATHKAACAAATVEAETVYNAAIKTASDAYGTTCDAICVAARKANKS